MRGNILEAVLGAFVLFLAGAFVYFAYSSGGEKINNGYIVFARFDNVSGLSNGADVKLNGIKVGIVHSLKIDEEYQAKVELLIKNGIDLPSDSKASISTEGLMGNKFVAIAPGFSKEKLELNDEIEFTTPALNLEELINKFVLGDKKKES